MGPPKPKKDRGDIYVMVGLGALALYLRRRRDKAAAVAVVADGRFVPPAEVLDKVNTILEENYQQRWKRWARQYQAWQAQLASKRASGASEDEVALWLDENPPPEQPSRL